MNKRYIFILFFLLTLAVRENFAFPLPEGSVTSFSAMQDPSKDIQVLYNGRAWRNTYSGVKGDQFLFTRTSLPGSLNINGYKFENLNLNYDIYNDELLIPKNNGVIIQLNKEMVDSFSLVYELRRYNFRNTDRDSIDGIKGFVNVLYSGKSSLFVKFRKEIQPLAVDDKYDLFFQTQKVYFLKKGEVYLLNGKRDLFKALKDYKSQLKAFMKKNGYKVSRKQPDSFIPVIRYYDTLSQ